MRPINPTSLIAVAIGVWLMLSPVIFNGGPVGYAVFNDVFVGLLLVGAGIWRALNLRAAVLAGWAMVALGAVEFISPWLYDRPDAAANVNAWICGVIAVVVGLFEARKRKGDRPAHGLYVVPDIFPGKGPESSLSRQPRIRRRRSGRKTAGDR